ncbi:MAG: sigma-70 family RNA polymerase sigma factor [Verrucomicrobia bacterium]|nr:sigma-70 family RNA polymerase sigma factor [Verrucomicrobiota bacterium]
MSRLRNVDDADSWRDFFDTYWKLIFNAAVKSGLSPTEAEDVVQETVINVARKMPEFRYDPKKGSFKGWLLRMTKWRILDHVRKRKRHAACEPMAVVSEDFGPIENIADPISELLDTLWEAEWQQNLMDAATQRIKRKVRPKHYQIFELHVLKQWPVQKVTKTLNIGPAEVHLVKHRVGNLLKTEVERLEKEGV